MRSTVSFLSLAKASSIASSIAHQAAGFALISPAFDAIHPLRDARSTMSWRNARSCRPKNACAVSRDSPVTYSLGQDSPQPVTPVANTTSAQRVEVSDRSADACRKATVKGICSGFRSRLRRRSVGMASGSDVVVEGEPQVLTVLQHDRLELALALPGVHACPLVCFRRPGLQPDDVERPEATARAFAVVLDVQLPQPTID